MGSVREHLLACKPLPCGIWFSSDHFCLKSLSIYALPHFICMGKAV